MPGDQPNRALAFGAIGWALVIERPELPARTAGGEGDPAGGQDALRLELAFDGVQLRVRRELAVAICLDINLVELQLRGDARELAPEIGRIG